MSLHTTKLKKDLKKNEEQNEEIENNLSEEDQKGNKSDEDKQDNNAINIEKTSYTEPIKKRKKYVPRIKRRYIPPEKMISSLETSNKNLKKEVEDLQQIMEKLFPEKPKSSKKKKKVEEPKVELTEEEKELQKKRNLIKKYHKQTLYLQKKIKSVQRQSQTIITKQKIIQVQNDLKDRQRKLQSQNLEIKTLKRLNKNQEDQIGLLEHDKAQFLSFNKFDEDISNVKSQLRKLHKDQKAVTQQNKELSRNLTQKLFELRDVCEQTGQLCKIDKKTHEVIIEKNKFYTKPKTLDNFVGKDKSWVNDLKKIGKWEPIEPNEENYIQTTQEIKKANVLKKEIINYNCQSLQYLRKQIVGKIDKKIKKRQEEYQKLLKEIERVKHNIQPIQSLLLSKNLIDKRNEKIVIYQSQVFPTKKHRSRSQSKSPTSQRQFIKVDWYQVIKELPIKLNKEDKRKRRKVFNRFDDNGNGFLSKHELNQGMQKVYGINKAYNIKHSIFRAYDLTKKHTAKTHPQDDSQFLQFFEFRTFLSSLKQYLEYYSTFNMIDSDNDQRVSLKEFIQAKHIMEKFLGKINDIEKTFCEIDGDGSDSVSFEEFCNWAISKNLLKNNIKDEKYETLKDQVKSPRIKSKKFSKKLTNRKKQHQDKKAKREIIDQNEIQEQKNDDLEQVQEQEQQEEKQNDDQEQTQEQYIILSEMIAKLTRDTEWIGNMDPYFVLTYGEVTKKSNVAEETGKNPQWKSETFKFIKKEDILQIKIEIFDSDPDNDDLVGSGIIAFNDEINYDDIQTITQDIYYEDKSAGSITFSIQVKKKS